MKNKWYKKVMAVLTAGVLSASVLAGCGAPAEEPARDTSGTKESSAAPGTSEAKTEEGTDEGSQAASLTYPIEGAGTLTYGMTLASGWKERYDSYAKLPLGQELQKETGYTLDMVHVENNTAMNLLIAGGDLPDILAFNFSGSYTGKEQKAISDGVIYPMTEEFLQENAPDYWAYLEAHPNVLKQVKTPEGYISGFAFILGDELLKSGFGMIVRDDMCEQLNMGLPETADEYYEMLKGMKEDLGVEIPLCVTNGVLRDMLDSGVFTSPFGLVTRSSYVDGDKVKIGYAQEEYKDVLAWLNKLYSEGLLDPNFSTVDQDTVTANMLTGVSGASAGACGSVLGTWLKTNKDVENWSLAGIRSLVAKKGDRPMFTKYNNDVAGVNTVITANCKDPAAAAKFLNFGYTEQGHLLYNFGIEGVSYNMVDGAPVYTDLLLNNPDGLTAAQAMSEYILATGNGPFIQDKNYLLQYYSTEEQKTAVERYADTDAAKYKLPNVTINLDNADEYSSLVSELETYRDEMTIKFIRGEESLDNFGKYLETLESMGVSRLIELLQAALDEYNSR